MTGVRSRGHVVFGPFKNILHLLNGFVLAVKRIAQNSKTEGNWLAREALMFPKMATKLGLKSPMFSTPTTTTFNSINQSLKGVPVGTWN